MTFTDFVEQETGSRNWVLARNTVNIRRRYGADVKCLTRKQYAALELKHELVNAEKHPACAVLAQWTSESADVIRALRNAGWRIEKVHTHDSR